jgi:hypothetical protein
LQSIDVNEYMHGEKKRRIHLPVGFQPTHIDGTALRHV